MAQSEDSSDPSSAALFVGVDVGSWTARALITDAHGRRRGGPTSSPVRTFRGDIDGLPIDHVEQSSDDLWKAVCIAVNRALDDGAVDRSLVKGIGFCGTCSLVALDSDFQPATVSTTGLVERNVIMWQDARATAEAGEINATRHPVLDYLGGQTIPQMDIPRIMWMKRHLKKMPKHLIELPDFLTLKATGVATRSMCSLVCKFNYMSSNDSHRGLAAGWSSSFMEACGLGDFDLAQVGGEDVADPGAPTGKGLCEAAAKDLGLPLRIAVGASLIDAYAGALGVLGCGTKAWSERLALVAGTSNCFVALSEQPVYAPGIWGPHASAVVPGLYCNDAGQNAGGLFLQHVVDSHPRAAALQASCRESKDVHSALDALIEEQSRLKGVHWSTLSQNVHITPDVCGNRSPWSRADMTAVISGSTLESNTEAGLAVQYVAAIQALAYGTRVVVDRLNTSGFDIKEVLVCGGLATNTRFLESIADILQVEVVVPAELEAGLLGASLLGASAAGIAADVPSAMSRFTKEAKRLKPNATLKRYHDAKHSIFVDLCEKNMAHADIMRTACR